jgi:hypothetical protein
MNLKLRVRISLFLLLLFCSTLLSACPSTRRSRRGIQILKEPNLVRVHKHLGLSCRKKSRTPRKTARDAQVCQNRALDQVMKQHPRESKVDIVDKRRSKLRLQWRSCMIKRGFLCL